MANSEIRMLENMCRTCMMEQQTEVILIDTIQKCKPLISMHDNHETKDSGNMSIMELLRQTSPQLTVEDDDILPKHICGNCLDVVVNFYEFQTKSLRVEQRLRDIIKEYHCSLEILDADPLNDYNVQQAEGGEDLKIEIDEFITDVATPARGYFTLIEKDGKIIEVYNDLEKCERDGSNTDVNVGGKCKTQFSTTASKARNKENENALVNKFWNYIGGDHHDAIPVRVSKGEGIASGVDIHLNNHAQEGQQLDKRTITSRKSKRRLEITEKISDDSNNRTQKSDDKDIATSNDMKEVAEEEYPESEVSGTKEVSAEDESEWEPSLNKSARFKGKSRKNDIKLKGKQQAKLELTNVDTKETKVVSVKLGSRTKRLKSRSKREQTPENGYICPECGIRLKTRITFRRHLSTHEKYANNSKLKCQYCNKIFHQTCKLLNHERRHTGECPFLCSVCGKSFHSLYSLNMHTQRHGTEFNYQCPECPKRFQCQSNMLTHRAIVHSTVRPHVCDVCGSSFKKPYSLRKHKIIHGEKKHKCDYCEMKFSQPEQCRRHMRTHTGEKPYKCRYCERSYSQNNEVMKHLRVHLGENVYRCEMCPQSFRMLCELKVHFCAHKDDDDETKSKNLQALKEEEKRIQAKIESEKATEEQS